VEPDRDLVAHRPGREEERRLVAEQLGDALLEPRGGRVGEALLVSDLGLGDRAPHALGRTRLRVAEEVDALH
jgi:hypothetical protein